MAFHKTKPLGAGIIGFLVLLVLAGIAATAVFIWSLTQPLEKGGGGAYAGLLAVAVHAVIWPIVCCCCRPRGMVVDEREIRLDHCCCNCGTPTASAHVYPRHSCCVVAGCKFGMMTQCQDNTIVQSGLGPCEPTLMATLDDPDAFAQDVMAAKGYPQGALMMGNVIPANGPVMPMQQPYAGQQPYGGGGAPPPAYNKGQYADAAASSYTGSYSV